MSIPSGAFHGPHAPRPHASPARGFVITKHRSSVRAASRRPSSACRKPDAGIAGRAASCHAHIRSRTAESFFVFACTLNAGHTATRIGIAIYFSFMAVGGCIVSLFYTFSFRSRPWLMVHGSMDHPSSFLLSRLWVDQRADGVVYYFSCLYKGPTASDLFGN